MEGPLSVVAILLAAYLLGSIPSAYIAGQITRGIDLRSVGSRNPGALNTFRQVGPWSAIAVLLADTLKGVLAVLAAIWLGEPPWACLYGAAGVVAGHNWPLFLGFRGGKGAATALGVSLAVLPLFTILAFVFAAALTRNVVLGAASGFVLINILAVITGQGWVPILTCLLLTLVVTATYLGRSWQQTISALRRGDVMELFSFE